jgi:hypothetical protein
MYAAHFNAPGLDPMLAMQTSFFETFVMATPPRYGVGGGNVLPFEWLLLCTIRIVALPCLRQHSLLPAFGV